MEADGTFTTHDDSMLEFLLDEDFGIAQVQFAEGIDPPNINHVTQDDDSSRGGESCYSFSSQLPHGSSISTISSGSIPNSTTTVQLNTKTAKPAELNGNKLKFKLMN